MGAGQKSWLLNWVVLEGSRGQGLRHAGAVKTCRRGAGTHGVRPCKPKTSAELSIGLVEMHLLGLPWLDWQLGFARLGLDLGPVLGHEMGQNVNMWPAKRLVLGFIMGLYGP